MRRSRYDLPLLVISCFVLRASCLGQNDPCSNPNNEPGQCVPLRRCKLLWDIYRKPRVMYQESSFLTSSHCGMEGDVALVCCVSPNPITSTSVPPTTVRPTTVPPTTAETCGIYFSDRIVGGNETSLGEFPWMALIQYRRTNRGLVFNCGGSVINSRYVVTAAHCFNPRPGYQVAGVRLGEHTISNEGKDCVDTECADLPVDFSIEKVIVHEEFNATSKNFLNDIALVRLDRDVIWSDYVQPICLPAQESLMTRTIVGHKLFAAGWGLTESGNPSDTKLKVILEIMEHRKCSSIYKSSRIIPSDRQLCAGGEKGKDTCKGDSGGPLMQRVGDRWVLYGIVSFGPNQCAKKGVPGIYTNVVKYINWIQSNVVL